MPTTDVFQALADETRRDVLRQLRAGPARVVDLADRAPISRPAISRHLRILSEAGLVTATDHGRERHYSLETSPLDDLAAYVDSLRGPSNTPRAAVTDRQLDALDTEVRRTARDRRIRTAARHTSGRDRASDRKDTA